MRFLRPIGILLFLLLPLTAIPASADSRGDACTTIQSQINILTKSLAALKHDVLESEKVADEVIGFHYLSKKANRDRLKIYNNGMRKTESVITLLADVLTVQDGLGC